MALSAPSSACFCSLPASWAGAQQQVRTTGACWAQGSPRKAQIPPGHASFGTGPPLVKWCHNPSLRVVGRRKEVIPSGCWLLSLGKAVPGPAPLPPRELAVWGRQMDAHCEVLSWPGAPGTGLGVGLRRWDVSGGQWGSGQGPQQGHITRGSWRKDPREQGGGQIWGYRRAFSFTLAVMRNQGKIPI